ncbi:excalibur calcium-binding domain-containing protein [Streptomyces sp. NPDC051207]|uniref:excalibur calcium-binding domain-containing protein n=1 Tax=Streptomyces sp. NPDC051207 TaxID=3154641 RepID=UPI00341F7AC6
MTHPYVTPDRPAPKWARKRYVLPALGLVFFLGIGAGAADSQPTDDAQPAAAKAQPTATVTATATTTAEPEPAPTETVKVKVKVTKTVTAEPASDAGADDSTGGSDGGSVSYDNCAAARAAGAAPVHRGDPGYGRHLDRDGDGTGCDWG